MSFTVSFARGLAKQRRYWVHYTPSSIKELQFLKFKARFCRVQHEIEKKITNLTQ